MNKASRVQTNGAAAKVHFTGTTYGFVKDSFVCTNSGKIQVKGKGEPYLYYVEGRV